MRTYLPDGEFVFSRSHISQEFYHPYRAIKAMGLDEPVEILDLYLDAFRGFKTKLLASPTDVFVNDLSRRIYGFYARSQKPLQLLYRELRKNGIFKEYARRFCKIDGLPSVLPSEILSQLDNDLSKYIEMVRSQGFKNLKDLAPAQILRVRLRRHFQTRAYFALTHATAFERDLDFSRVGTRYDRSSIVLALDRNLEQLERALQDLASGYETASLIKRASTIDRDYMKTVQRPLRAADVWMSKRSQYWPETTLPNHEFGLLEGPLMNTVVLRARGDFMIEQFYASLASRSRRRPGSNEVALKQQRTFLRESLRDGWKSKTELERARRYFNAAATSRGVLEQWSQPLFETRPTKNQFNELLFVYE